MRARPVTRALIVADLSTGLVAGCSGVKNSFSSFFSPSHAATNASQIETRPVASGAATLPDFSALVAQYGPAVVNNTPVNSGRELRALVDKASDHVALLVQHGDAKIFVPIDLG